MKIVLISFIAILMFYITSANAQNKEHLGFMNQQQSEQLFNTTIALSDPKLVKAQAELIHQQYKALIIAGFDKDEALKIIVAMSSKDKK